MAQQFEHILGTYLSSASTISRAKKSIVEFEGEFPNGEIPPYKLLNVCAHYEACAELSDEYSTRDDHLVSR